MTGPLTALKQVDRAEIVIQRALNCGWISIEPSVGYKQLLDTIRIALDTEVRAGGPYLDESGVDSQPTAKSSKVVSIQDGMFVCTDGAGYFTRPATEDEKLFWDEVIRLRTEHEEDLNRMERAAETIERLTERLNEIHELGQQAANRADDAERRAGETPVPQHYGLGNCGCKECDWFRKHPQCRPESLGGTPKSPAEGQS